MKKLVALLLLFVIILSSAGCVSAVPSNSTSSGEVSASQGDIISSSEKASSLDSLSFGISSEDFYEEWRNSIDEGPTKQPLAGTSKEYDVLVGGYGGTYEDWQVRVLCYSESGTGYLSAVLLSAPAASSEKAGIVMNAALNVLGVTAPNSERANFVRGLQDFQPHTLESVSAQLWLSDDTKSMKMAICPVDNAVPPSELPVEVSYPDSVFFSDAERFSAFQSAIESYDYAAAASLISDYSDELSMEIHGVLTENDVAHIVETCTVSVDPVESGTNIFYNGCEEISRENNIIAFVQNGQYQGRIGFVALDWVFFEEIILNYGDGGENEKKVFGYSSVTRDVLSGGGVREYSDFLLPMDDIPRLTPGAAIVRFIGEGDKTLDHTLTDTEIDCLQTIATVRRIYSFTSEFCENWAIYYQ